MNKLIRSILDPIWFINRLEEKFITYPKYKRIHYKSFRELLKFLQYDFNDFKVISDEFLQFNELHNFINRKFLETNINNSYPPERYSWPVLLYFLIRKTQPEVVVETGCWYGNSSVCILAALKKNGKGKLFTIDLPAFYETGGYYDENPYLSEENRTSSLPEGTIPGFIVPEFLKDRWNLILGPTSEKLSPLLEKLGKIDFFLHDSLHSSENMSFEFNLAYEYLKQEGILASDNIDWNGVFKKFSSNKKSCTYLAYYETVLLKNNFGIILKS